MSFVLLFLVTPSQASVQVETGTFVANTGSATTTVTTGFQGKAVILFTHGKTALSETATAAFSIGFSDGTHHETVAWAGDDSIATTNVGRAIRGTNALSILTDGTPTESNAISGVAFNATPNMVLTWNTTPSAAWQISYVLFGGADITNVFVGHETALTTTGTKNVTNVGFQGDAFIFLHGQKTASGTNAHAATGIGFALSSSKQWAWSGSVYDAQTTSANVNGMSVLHSDACLIGQVVTSNVNDFLADFTQSTASGFDLNFTDGAASAYLFSYLVIKGGQWDGGVSTKPATATTQSVTGMSFQPKALLAWMSSPTALSAYASNAISTFGAATGASARAYAGAYHNDAINTVAKSAGSSTAILHEMNATANADFTSFNSDGWTVTWDNTGTAFLVPWFALGDNGGGSGTKLQLSGGVVVSGGVTLQ